MKNSKNHAVFKVSLIILSFHILISCTTFEPEVITSENPTTEGILTTQVATPTKIAPVENSKVEVTMSPEIIPTVIDEVSTVLQIPTPHGDSRPEQVLWLLETNNGCLLPCWWGIIPGQTDWITAEQLLRRFDNTLHGNSSTSNQIGYTITVPLPRNVFSESETDIGILTENGIVKWINTRVSIGDTPEEYLEVYKISSFLETYGPPSQIWISTFSSPREFDDLPFRILLYYPDLGIMAMFSDNAVLEDGYVIGCPQTDPVKAMSLWSPKEPRTVEEILNSYSVYNVNFTPLEETMTVDVNIFYETFKDPFNEVCLETPADIWQ